MDKKELGERLALRQTEVVMVKRGQAFDAQDIRDAFSLLGKKYQIPAGAKLVVRVSGYDVTREHVHSPNDDVAVDVDAMDSSGNPLPPVELGEVVDFEFTWEEQRESAPPRARKSGAEE